MAYTTVKNSQNETWILEPERMRQAAPDTRWVSRQDVQTALIDKNFAIPIGYGNWWPSIFGNGFLIRRLGHGAINVGCQTFSARQVRKIRQWAFNREA